MLEHNVVLFQNVSIYAFYVPQFLFFSAEWSMKQIVDTSVAA